MHAKDFLIYNGGNWKAVEAVCKRFPEFDTEPPFTCVQSVNNCIKPILVINITTRMKTLIAQTVNQSMQIEQLTYVVTNNYRCQQFFTQGFH